MTESALSKLQNPPFTKGQIVDVLPGIVFEFQNIASITDAALARNVISSFSNIQRPCSPTDLTTRGIITHTWVEVGHGSFRVYYEVSTEESILTVSANRIKSS